MANRELTEFHRIDWATAHADVALDSQGNEVIVMQNVRTDYIDLIPLDPATQPILDSGGSYAGYESDAAGAPLLLFLLVRPGQRRPHLLQHARLLRRVDLHRARRARAELARPQDHPGRSWTARGRAPTTWPRSTARAAEYWEETHATITRDGSRVVWATNWNQNVGAERVWLMELDLPAGWRQSC